MWKARVYFCLVALLVGTTLGQVKIVHETSGLAHMSGVNKIIYNPHLKLVATSSYDGTIGIWDEDLNNNQYLDKSLFPVREVFNGELLVSQISALDWAYYQTQSYLITNLMGQYLKVFLIDQKSRTLKPVNLISFDKEIIAKNSWAILENTNRIIVSTSTKLFMRNFISGDDIFEVDISRRARGLCMINDRDLMFSTHSSLVHFDITQRRAISNQGMKFNALYIVSLSGINSGTKTEIAVSMPMAQLDIYQYDQITYGKKRTYHKLHNFYESQTLVPIPYTVYAISGAGDKTFVIFDIVNSQSGSSASQMISLFKSAIHDSSILSIDYLKNTNTFYASFYGVEDGATGLRYAKYTFCKDPKCITCSTSYDTCEKCGIGYALSSEGESNKCLDCSSPYNFEHPGCVGTYKYRLAHISKTDPRHYGFYEAEDGTVVDLSRTGALVQFVIEDAHDFYDSFNYQGLAGLHAKINMELSNLEDEKDYIYSYLIVDRNLYIGMNFTTDPGEVEMKVSLFNGVLIEKSTTQSSLVVLNEVKTCEFFAVSKFSEPILRGASKASTILAYLAGITLVIVGFLSLISICCNLGIGSGFFSLFQILQIVSTVVLINVDYGDLLTTVLNTLLKVLNCIAEPLIKFMNISVESPTISRGKLGDRNIDILILLNLPYISLAYILVWAYYWNTKRIYKYATQKTSGDLSFIKKVKHVRFFLWNLVILDYCLFGMHEILHHKPLKYFDRENFFSVFCFVVTSLGLLLALKEFVLLCNYAFKFYDGDVSYVVSEASSSNASGASRLLHQYEMTLRKVQARISVESKDSIEVKNGLKRLYANSLVVGKKSLGNPLNTLKTAMQIQNSITRMSLGVGERQLPSRFKKQTDASKVVTAQELVVASANSKDNMDANDDPESPKLKKFMSDQAPEIMEKDFGLSSAFDEEAQDPKGELLKSAEPVSPGLIKYKSTEPAEITPLKNPANKHTRGSFASSNSSSSHSNSTNSNPKSKLRNSLSRTVVTSFGNNSLKLMNLEKRIESRYYPTVARGIHVEKLDSPEGLSFNILWLTRLCAILLAVAALQQKQLLQVLSVVLINTLFFVHFVKMYWKKKLFAKERYSSALFVFEWCLELFVIGVLVMFINQHIPFMSFKITSALQIVMAGLIFISVLMFTIVILIDTFSTLYEHIQASIQNMRDRKRAEKIIIQSENSEQEKMNPSVAIPSILN